MGRRSEGGEGRRRGKAEREKERGREHGEMEQEEGIGERLNTCQTGLSLITAHLSLRIENHCL